MAVARPAGRNIRRPVGRDSMKRNILSVAVVLGMASRGSHAQEQETSAPAGQQVQATTLDGVTVTARRRTESIQDVPVAVSAFGEEQLRDLQAQDVSGLQGAVPNLNIVPGRGSSNTVNVFIRGIGQPDSLQTFDPGVGMYRSEEHTSELQSRGH